MKNKLNNIIHRNASELTKAIAMKRNANDAMILITMIDEDPKAVIQGEMQNVLGLIGMLLSTLEDDKKMDAFQILKEEILTNEEIKELHKRDEEFLEAHELNKTLNGGNENEL